MLDEVVVTGYSTQKKADLTGSLAVVSTKTLKTATDADPMKSLQGKVPGMTITANPVARVQSAFVVSVLSTHRKIRCM